MDIKVEHEDGRVSYIPRRDVELYGISFNVDKSIAKNFAISTTQAKRLRESGAVRFDNEVIEDLWYNPTIAEVEDGIVVNVGKKFIKMVKNARS
jgi:tyrosyl-tRNA synthetase